MHKPTQKTRRDILTQSASLAAAAVDEKRRVLMGEIA